MTEEKKSLRTNYLTVEIVEFVYNSFYKHFLVMGEPIEPWFKVDKKQIENLVDMPKGSFGGSDLYPTLSEKAAIILYKINKGHIFPNGNKRLSIACVLLFLALNGKDLKVTSDELTKKALEVAMSDPNDFEKIKFELKEWLEINLIDLP